MCLCWYYPKLPEGMLNAQETLWPNTGGLTRRNFVTGLATATIAFPGISPVVPSGAGSSQAALWFNPPKHWKLEGSSLLCTADLKTDFWRETFYGYVTYSGHLYYRRVSGDFTTQVKVTGQYHDLYGQAGLMVRIGAESWMSAASSS